MLIITPQIRRYRYGDYGVIRQLDSVPNYWVGTQFLDNTIAGDGSIPRLIVADGDRPPSGMSTETIADDNSPDLEETRNTVEVKKVETSQTTLFPPGPWWR